MEINESYVGQNKDDHGLTRSVDAAMAALFGEKGLSIPTPFSRDILLMQTVINGTMRVDNIRERAAALKEGTVVRLVLEPNNPADERAILVKDPEGQKLGYIPRLKNEIPYHLLDAGKNLYGVVITGNIGENLDVNDSWIDIYIDVYMKD